MENVTENEKSIEKIALENYAEKELDQRYESVGILVGVVVGILSAVSFAWSIIHCEHCLHDYVMIGFFTIILGGITGMFAMSFIIIFSLGSRRNKNKITKIILLLSEEDRKKIISDYIQKAIQSCQDNIPYCEEEIRKLQSEIDELKESIEESNQRITELQNYKF